MQFALSLALIVLVALMLLLPPISFARSLTRYYRRVDPDAGVVLRLFVTVSAFLPTLINVGYLAYAWPNLRQGILHIDQNLGIALVIAWTAFWARLALGRRGLGSAGRRSRRRRG